MRIILVFIFLHNTQLLYSQPLKTKTEYPTPKDFTHLNKEQFYTDFDTLVKWISLVSPMYLVNNKLKHQDFLIECKKLRKGIVFIHSNEEFLKIVYKILNLIQDPHASILSNKSFISPSLLYPKDSANIQSSCTFYDSLLNRSVRSTNIKVRLPIKYVNGKYIVYYPFTVKNTFIDSGFAVNLINGRNIHQVIAESIVDIAITRYDFVKNISYTDGFYRIRDFYKGADSSISLQFVKGKTKITVKLKASDTAIFNQKIRFFNFNGSDEAKKVVYIDSLRILYIRMPLMSSGAFYISEINKYINKKPAKIIFDIRGNPGGQDFSWAAPLKKIIEDSLHFPLYFGFKNNPFMNALSREFLDKSLFEDSSLKTSVYKSPLLANESFFIFKKLNNYFTKRYAPDSLSMHYRGPIYLLCDGNEYSSTGNFLSFARGNANIVSIGMNSGLFGGTEFTPLPFILPNSKIIFRLEPVLDFKNVEAIKDFYHNYIDIPYYYSVKDMYNICTFHGDVSDLQFLLNKDPLFNIVKNHK